MFIGRFFHTVTV